MGFSLILAYGVRRRRTTWSIQRGSKMAAGHPTCGRPPLKQPSGCFRIGCLQGIEGSGMAGPGDMLGNLWPPLATRPWLLDDLISFREDRRCATKAPANALRRLASMMHKWRPTPSAFNHRRTAWDVRKSRRVGHPPCGRTIPKRPQGRFREGLLAGHRWEGMAGSSDTLGSPWPLLAIRPCQPPWIKVS
jgi:hypothetical protein